MTCSGVEGGVVSVFIFRREQHLTVYLVFSLAPPTPADHQTVYVPKAPPSPPDLQTAPPAPISPYCHETCPPPASHFIHDLPFFYLLLLHIWVKAARAASEAL